MSRNENEQRPYSNGILNSSIRESEKENYKNVWKNNLEVCVFTYINILRKDKGKNDGRETKLQVNTKTRGNWQGAEVKLRNKQLKVLVGFDSHI